MFPGHSMRIRSLISRVGMEAVISRKTGSGTDRLNHSTATYESVDTALCALYNPDSGFGQTAAGELDLDAPTFAFPTSADIRVNDRITYDLNEYEVDSVTPRPTHTVVQTKAV